MQERGVARAAKKLCELRNILHPGAAGSPAANPRGGPSAPDGSARPVAL